MLSLGGAIGTGLFLGSGEVISQTGAIGAIIAYILGGAIAYMVMLCLGELAVHMPVSGSFWCLCQKIYQSKYWLYDFLDVLAHLDCNAWNRIHCRSPTHARMVPADFDVDLDNYFCSYYFWLKY